MGFTIPTKKGKRKANGLQHASPAGRILTITLVLANLLPAKRVLNVKGQRKDQSQLKTAITVSNH